MNNTCPNHQNDRHWTAESPLSYPFVKDSQHTSSEMNWGVICEMVQILWFFMKPLNYYFLF